MLKSIQRIFFTFALYITMALAVTTIPESQSNGQDIVGGDFVEAIISPDNCTSPPCFLNQPVEDISFDSAMSTLGRSGLVELESIEQTTNEIRWEWLEDTIQRLTQGKVVEYSIIDENILRFDEDGTLIQYNLAIHIPLKEILTTFGEDFIVLPWTSHRVLGAGYAIFYPHLPGYFVVYTDCEEPYLTDTSDVTNYVFIQTRRIEVGTINQFAIWRGYDTKLPTCSAFPAG